MTCHLRVDTLVIEPGPLQDAQPGMLQLGEIIARLAPGDDAGVAVPPALPAPTSTSTPIVKRDGPELRDVPPIVSGRHRGVVTACCDITRPSSGFSNPPVSPRRQDRRREYKTPATPGALDPFGRLLP